MLNRIEAAARWARQWQAGLRVPGMALVINDRDQTLHVELSGLADRNGMRAVDAAQRWQIGSISKAFSSTAVLQVEGRGQLLVNARLAPRVGAARSRRSPAASR